MTLTRCPWSSDDPLMISYHDHEWGVPVHEDIKLFEHILRWLSGRAQLETYSHKEKTFVRLLII